MATIGKTTNGSMVQAYSSDRKLVSQFTDSGGGVVKSGVARMYLASAVSTPVKMIVYSDTSDNPDVLLAVSDEVLISNTSGQAIVFPFSGTNQISLTSGTKYWIGVIYDYQSATVNVSRDNTASKVQSNNDTYSDGPLDPWTGAVANTAGPIDVYLITDNITSAQTTTFASSVTSMSVNLPPDILSGDLLIAHVGIRNTGTWTAPTGWVSLASQLGGGSVGQTDVWYKVADGSEGSTATWTAGVATTAAWQVRRIISWHGTTPPEAAKTNGDSTTAPNPPSLTPSWGAEDTIWLALAGSAANTMNFTAAPTNYVDLTSTVASSGGGASNAGSAIRQNNTATEDPGVFTTSQNRWWSAITVAVRPAGSGGGPTLTNGFKVYDGSSFSVKPVKYYNGTSWEEKPLKRYNGSSWVDVEY